MVRVGRTREERIYNPAKEYFSKEKEKPVYEEEVEAMWRVVK